MTSKPGLRELALRAQREAQMKQTPKLKAPTPAKKKVVPRARVERA